MGAVSLRVMMKVSLAALAVCGVLLVAQCASEESVDTIIPEGVRSFGAPLIELKQDDLQEEETILEDTAALKKSHEDHHHSDKKKAEGEKKSEKKKNVAKKEKSVSKQLKKLSEAGKGAVHKAKAGLK